MQKRINGYLTFELLVVLVVSATLLGMFMPKLLEQIEVLKKYIDFASMDKIEALLKT